MLKFRHHIGKQSQGILVMGVSECSLKEAKLIVKNMKNLLKLLSNGEKNNNGSECMFFKIQGAVSADVLAATPNFAFPAPAFTAPGVAPVTDSKSSAENTSTKTPYHGVFLTVLQKAREQLMSSTESKKLTEKLRVTTVTTEQGAYTFFGVDVDEQQTMEFKTSKEAIMRHLDLKETTETLQLVGDTDGYSKEGTEYAYQFIKQKMNEYSHAVMWYGFTGRRGWRKVDPKLNDLTCWGANQILNELIAKEPVFAKRVIGNVVDLHTFEAVKSWGCDLSENLRNFYLVYSKGDPKCTFGKDIKSSDGLTTALGVCLDGGIQSFAQCISMLNNSVKLVGVANLRGDNNPATYNAKATRYIPLFSAAQFLNKVKTFLTYRDVNTVTSDDMEKLLKEYMADKSWFKESDNDANTKPALLESGWSQFIRDKIWLKIATNYEGIEFQVPSLNQKLKF